MHGSGHAGEGITGSQQLRKNRYIRRLGRHQLQHAADFCVQVLQQGCAGCSGHAAVSIRALLARPWQLTLQQLFPYKPPDTCTAGRNALLLLLGRIIDARKVTRSTGVGQCSIDAAYLKLAA